MFSALDTPGGQHRLWFSLGLVVLCVLLYGRAATYEFVWDDADLIVRNPVVLGEAPLETVFTQDFWWAGGSDAFIHNLWRPLTLLYYRGLSEVSGAPWAYHAGSIGLHAAVTVLLFLIASGHLPLRTSLFAAALFAAHPLRVSSVAWVSGSGDLLCAALLLVSLQLLEAGRARGMIRHAASVFVFGLAVLSKEAAFILPPFLTVRAALEPDPANRRAALLHSLPFWILAGALFTVRRTVLETTGLFGGSFGENLLTAPVLLARYLLRMTLPFPHSVHSDMAPVTGLDDWRLWVSVGVLAVGGRLIFSVLSGRGRRLSAPVLWTILFLAPVCVGRFSRTLFAERYTYIPALGFSVVLALGMTATWGAARRWLPRWPRHGAVWAALPVALLAGLSLSRVPAWKNDATLYATMLRQNPADTTASFNLGLAAAGRGDYATAETYFLQTLQNRPGHSGAHNSLGNIAWSRGEMTAAEQHYRAAVASEANYQAIFNLATLLDGAGRCREARERYRSFVAGAPPELGDAVQRARDAVRRLDRQEAQGACR